MRNPSQWYKYRKVKREYQAEGLRQYARGYAQGKLEIDRATPEPQNLEMAYQRGYAQGFHDGSETHSRCRSDSHIPSSSAPLATICTDCYMDNGVVSDASADSI